MNRLKIIKHIIFFLLTFLLGAQTTHAKTELLLPQNNVLFSIKQTQNIKSLEKELQPNIGFLKEKSRFVVSEGVSAQKPHEFSGSLVKEVANGVVNIPSSLATKLGNTLNIENWLVKYADELGDATPLLTQLDNSIGTRNVLTHLEDAQGRLVTVIERPGQSNLVSVIHKDVNGTYKLTEFSPAYNPSLNPSIPVPLSANKLVPDYMGTQYMHPLQGNQTVKIKLSGTRNTDFTRARAELGITKADEIVNGKNYTWHHMDDFEIINGEPYCTMQLVESTAHQGTGVFGMQHSGSVAQYRAYFNSGY